MSRFKGSVRLYCMAGAARPSPKIGQALGPLGLNMMQFCKEFNDRTAEIRPDVPLRVLLKAYEDRSFKFVTKPPPTTWFLKKASGLESGSGAPGHRSCGRISIKYIYEIAKVKQETDQHLQFHDLEGIVRMICGTCQSMGLDIVEDTLPPKKINIDL
ncbi:unnamed protein product [Moneuplotes crassus]|uniref:Large ribosomal subunit protein uL11m n=1 Tax=Euplotes crassus TaxID=5936 RepID=A0AAD1Y147_EUPCR|nr:unnamed protein product [Moneuplotes crassus]